MEFYHLIIIRIFFPVGQNCLLTNILAGTVGVEPPKHLADCSDHPDDLVQNLSRISMRVRVSMSALPPNGGLLLLHMSLSPLSRLIHDADWIQLMYLFFQPVLNSCLILPAWQGQYSPILSCFPLGFCCFSHFSLFHFSLNVRGNPKDMCAWSFFHPCLPPWGPRCSYAMSPFINHICYSST